MLGDIRHLDLFDAILEAHHDLVIPRSVYVEICRDPAATEMARSISEGMIRVTDAVSELEVARLKSEDIKLDSGEIDVIITYEKIADGGGSYRILDDKRARRMAERRGVRFTGMIGLLTMVRDRGLISTDAPNDAIACLKKAGFYMPKGA